MYIVMKGYLEPFLLNGFALTREEYATPDTVATEKYIERKGEQD